MIINKTGLSDVVSNRDEKNLVNSTINLQYSLSLIEASLDYLFMINNHGNKDKNSAIKIIEKLISLSSFKDEPGKLVSSKEMLKELLKDHERISLQLRNSFEKYKEKDEAKLIASIIEKHQSIARKLRKYF